MIKKQKKKKKKESSLQVTQNPPANLFMLLSHDKNHNPFSSALVYTVHGFQENIHQHMCTLSIALTYRQWAKNHKCLIRHMSKPTFFTITEPYSDFQKFFKKIQETAHPPH